MENTIRHKLPYIIAAQAQKHVTHNEALRMIDALLQISVKQTGVGDPPASPQEGDAYIVGDPATGNWAGRENQLAAYQDGAWAFMSLTTGTTVWNEALQVLLVHDGSGLVSLQQDLPDTLATDRLAINTAIDANHRLTVAAESVRLSHETSDQRLYINKASSTDTAAVLFQSGNTAHGEIGLAGNNNLTLKASADGTTFREALTVDSATGRVGFPNSNFVDSPILNVYRGSGRMCNTDTTAVTIDGFRFPDYFAPYNGTVAGGQAKFIHNNSTYGGVAGALDSSVQALVDKIREPTHRRFGLEFWVAKMTHGSGTIGSLTNGGETFYISMFTKQTIQLPVLTLHFYLRAIDHAVVVKQGADSVIFADGIEQTGDFRLEPAQNWVSILIQRTTSPRTQYGYQPWYLEIYAKSAGHRWHFCCPALMPGLARVDPDIGLIAYFDSWPS